MMAGEIGAVRASIRWERQMEPIQQSVVSLADVEIIPRIARGERTPANEAVRDRHLTRKGQAALDMVHQVADAVSAMESRLETRLVQVLEKLKLAEDRNRALEARAAQAETRALEAEKWLKRLHNAMEDKITSRMRAQGRFSAAA
jgi:hypothetical protein